MVFPTQPYLDGLAPADAFASASEGASTRRSRPGFKPAPTGSWPCRMLDLSISAVALVVLSPVFAVIALLVKLQDGGQILFRQQRVGLDGARFTCLKFRSMRPNAEAHLDRLLAADPALKLEWDQDQKLKGDPRITAIGAFLRATSLDELPQLYNILTGDMSLVGPRPIVPDEIERYGRWYRYYCGMKPGLTGLWQVSGRNNVTYRRRVAMDRRFHRKRSLPLYLFIILATIPAVILRRGSY